ncbi:MAG: hypothetical protein JWQ73_628 [Variovorax sp.]|nr:hypothetical protein [Variovorax sp.]
MRAAAVPRTILHGVFLSAVAFGWAGDARADADDTFNATIGHSEQTDSNLFRLPDDTSAAPLLGTNKRSERIGITSAAVSLDKSYSLQHFQLAASVVDYHYQNFSYLSFTALNYAASWQWSLTPRLKGSLSTTRAETPTSYQDFQGFNTRNVRTDTVTRLDGEYDLGGAWRLLGAVDHTTGLEEQPVAREGDARSDSGAVGIRYVFPSNNSVSYRLRRASGDTIGVLGASLNQSSSFDDRIHEFEASWALTGKTKVIGHLGHLDRKYNDVSQRNFGGTTGDVNLQWAATGKITVDAVVRRELASYQTIASNYIATDRFVLTPLWKATSQINVKARYEIASRNYAGTAPGALAIGDRRDIYRAASFGVDWQPIRAATITLMLQRLKNTSNILGGGYDSNGATLGAQFSF